MTTRYKQYIYKNGEWILLGGTGSGNIVSNTYLLKAAGQNGVTHATTTSGNTYLNLVENGAVIDKINFYPNGGLSITSDATGKILFTNTGVRTVAQKSNGILTVNTGGTSADVTVYTLPTAASDTLGGIKVGSNLTINENGVLSGKAGTVTSITLIAGTGISLDTNNTAITTSGSRTITNSGVRDVTESTSNGYISVDKGGTVKQVPVHGLGDRAFDSNTYILASAKGAASGVAPLNASSKIDATYLPSYVDDVLEYNSTSNFPSSGTSGIIYLAIDTGFIYRWSGTQYVNVSADTNTTYAFSEGENNGEIKVTPTPGTAYNVKPKGLAAAAYKGVTDNSSATAVTSSDTNLITARTLYNAGYVKSSGVTSITLTQGDGITISNSGTAITGTGSRTITNAGVRTVTKPTDTNGIINVNTGGTSQDMTVYSLPTASSSVLGGIKVGSNLSISNGVLSGKAGTVTSVGITGDSYIGVSGSPITSSGTITLSYQGITDVNYDTTNKKFTKTINGTTSDIRTAAQLKSDMSLNNVENTKLSTWAGSTNITTLGTISSGTVPLANISGADDLKAIEALTGTAGILKKTAANTWALDTAYVSVSDLLTDGTTIGKLTIGGSTVTLKAPTPSGLYTLPTATSDALGGIKTGYTTSENNRAVQVDANGNAYVVQKDSNDNATYTIGSSLSSHKITTSLTAGGSGGTSTNTDFTLAAGSNITLTDDTTNRKITIAATDTNNAVTQTATNTNANYEVLFSATADNTTRTEGARKYSNLTFNPSTGTLTATTFSGSLAWSNISSKPNNGSYVYTVAKGTNNGTLSVNTNGSTATVTLEGAPYLSLANGGTVTGETTFNNAVSINDELYVDSINSGNLIVTGAGRFTNGIYGNLTGNITGTASGNLTNVTWDSTRNTITKTINGTTSDVVKFKAGNGLQLSNDDLYININHSNSVTAKTAAAQSAKTLTWGGTFTLYEEKYDAQGHITGVANYNMTMPANPNTTYQLGGSLSSNTFTTTLTPSSGTATSSALTIAGGTGISVSSSGSTITVTNTISNTDTKLQVAEVTSGTTYYPIVGTGTTAATRQYDTTGFIYVGTNGTTSAVGSAKLTLGNSTASGTANNKQGQLVIYGSTAYAHTIQGAPSANRTLTLPNATGTIALTSDIPTVSYPVTSVNNKTGAVSLTASDVGALASNTTYVSTITTTAGTHSAISSKSGAVSFNVPTKTSHLTNDSGFITASHTSTYSLPLAASGTRGGVQIGYTQSGKNYPVQLSNEKMYVNVPWTDTNTEVSTLTLVSGSTAGTSLAYGGKYTLTAGSKTVSFTMPASDNTDEKVKLTSNTGSTAVPLVLGPTSISSGTAYNCLYNTNLKYTPSTGNLQTTQLNGVAVGSSPKFTDTHADIKVLEDAGTYHPIWYSNISGSANAEYLFENNGFTYTTSNGTASALGYGIITAGNVTSANSVGNKQGVLRLYSNLNHYVDIKYMEKSSPNIDGIYIDTSSSGKEGDIYLRLTSSDTTGLYSSLQNLGWLNSVEVTI